MTESTHTWTHDTPRVRADGTRIEQGDEIIPTDHELRCWPDRLEPVDDDSAPVVERDAEQSTEEPTEIQRLIDEADYRTLQKVAGHFDDIDASQSTSDLRAALRTEADEADVLDAFADVKSEEAADGE